VSNRLANGALRGRQAMLLHACLPASIIFTDYLLSHRLEVAKDWLLNTDMKIGEIAERLRYNSSASCIRCFRKMEGMIPGQFRQQAGLDGE